MNEARSGGVRSGKSIAVALTATVAVVLAMFVSSASGTGTATTISVAIVANPQMQDIASLTPSLFSDRTNIEVN